MRSLRLVCTLTFILLLVTPILAGLNPANAQDPTATPVPKPQCQANAKTINYWHGLTGPDGNYLTKMVDQYNSSNKDGLCVALSNYTWDVFFTKWLSAIAAGNPPDVVTYHINEMPQYATLGAVVPIDDLAKQVGIDMTVYPDEQQKLSVWNGKLMGVPLDVHPIAMYINTDMAKAAGLDASKPPTDRTTFLDWAQKLTKSDGSQYGVCFGAANVQSFRVWYGWLWQNDAKFISDDLKTITINSPEAQETLQFGRDLIAKYKVAAPESQNPDVDFQNKKCAIHFQGPWWITGYMNTPGLNFMTAPQPVIFKHPAVWASDHFFGISKQDNKDNQLAAMKFVKWMGENAATWGTAGQVPANKNAREDKTFTGNAIYPYIQAFIAEVPYAHLTPVIPQSTEIFAENVQTPLVVNYQGAFLGQKDVPAALKDMQEGIQAVLDKG